MEYPRPQKVTLVVQADLGITTAALLNYTEDWGLSPRLRPVVSPSNQIRKYDVMVGALWLASDEETVLRDGRLSLGTIRLTALPGDETEAVITRGYWEQAHEQGYIDSEKTLKWYQQFFDRLVDTLVTEYGATGERVITPRTAFEERVEIGKPQKPTGEGTGDTMVLSPGKPGRPGLDHSELIYRLVKAQEGQEIRRETPDKYWKEIAREIGWNKGPDKRGVASLRDARKRLHRLAPDDPLLREVAEYRAKETKET